MSSPFPLAGSLARGRALVRTPPVLARYLDDLAKADRIAGDWDSLAAIARGMDDSLPPRAQVPPGDYTTVIDSMLPDGPQVPLSDMLLENERRRALIASRLDRLTPEQRAQSLHSVGRRYEADREAARAAEIQHARDVNTAAALAAAGIVGGGAMYGRMSQLAEEAARSQAQNTFDLGPDLSGNPDGAMPMTIDTNEDPLLESVTESVNAMAMPLVKVRPPRDFEGEALIDQLSGVPHFAGGQAVPQSTPWMRPKESSIVFEEDPMANLEPDSPDDAIAAAPGPSTPVGQNMDIERLPGPQMRSVRALIRAGIPSGRAMDIITRGASMSPDEYRMVTGGRR